MISGNSLSQVYTTYLLGDLAHSSSQRLSKDFHTKLENYTTHLWGSVEPGIKASLRRQLKEACDEQGLFVGRNKELALEWRLYQLERIGEPSCERQSQVGHPPLNIFSEYLN